jgi:L-asparaginase II
LQQLFGEPVVEVTRGDLVESIHDVAACAMRANGDILLALGDIETPVFLRSSAKPFIAAAAIAAGALEKFSLEQSEIAVMAASHSGEPFHIAAVRSILKKIGLDESALQCGAHYPYNEAAAAAMRDSGENATAIHNNCSGKHAGILALCKLIGADTATYMDLNNPAQQRILALCARLSDDDPATWPLGVDGCGIPVYATPLRNAALSFARFATVGNSAAGNSASVPGITPQETEALRIVRDAMIAYPEYVSGTGEFDASLMRAGGGNIACKVGAEGVHGVAAIAQGIGYVSKVIDGASRGRGPSTVEALSELGVLDKAQVKELAPFGHPIVTNRAGRIVGEVRSRSLAGVLQTRNAGDVRDHSLTAARK